MGRKGAGGGGKDRGKEGGGGRIEGRGLEEVGGERTVERGRRRRGERMGAWRGKKGVWGEEREDGLGGGKDIEKVRGRKPVFTRKDFGALERSGGEI